MNIRLHRQWVIRDKNGKVVRRTRKRLSESYVLAFIDLLYVQMSQASLNIPYTTAGADVDVQPASRVFEMAGAAQPNYSGLVVGTGTNAVALADWGLQTIIADGIGAGELQYGNTTVTPPVTSGTTRKITLSQTFTNNSGGTITIRETGIYAAGDTSQVTFCIARDLENQAITDGNTGTLTYTISVTV